MNQKSQSHVQEMILAWYAQEGRDLPWRHTTDLYRIMVSEIMLQQTNVPKVIEKYNAFLTRFPDVGTLARARQSSVLMMWQGLGYNRRALNLHRTAKVILRDYGGVFPETEDALGALPGIGPYTRAAILAFGRNADVSAMDVNIERVIRRLLGHGVWPADTDVTQTIATWVPPGRSRDWHNAVMDLASLHCTKKSPSCDTCPLREVCLSYPAPEEPQEVKKREQGRTEQGKHIPRRIYRGRIIERLRTSPATAEEIGREIKSDFGPSDHDWLRSLLRTLEKEEFIREGEGVWSLR